MNNSGTRVFLIWALLIISAFTLWVTIEHSKVSVGVNGSEAYGKHKVMGYIGCSVTNNAITGYRSVGGQRFWEVQDYGGGSVSLWAKDRGNHKYWDEFDRALAGSPETRGLWIQLCTHAEGGDTDTYEAAVRVVEKAREKLPKARIYVSAQPRYSGGHICTLAGSDGPARMESVADQIISERLARRGPVMGPLSARDTRDGCHANRDGRATMGSQLKEFFD